MRRDTVRVLFEFAVITAAVSTVIALVVLSTSVRDGNHGAGPVLIRALDDGWQPAPAPRREGSR